MVFDIILQMALHNPIGLKSLGVDLELHAFGCEYKTGIVIKLNKELPRKHNLRLYQKYDYQPNPNYLYRSYRKSIGPGFSFT